MARRKDDGWLGRRPVLWALYEAEGVPARLVSTLVAVAARAGEDGRGAFPSVAEIAAVTRKAERAVREDLAALRKLGLLLPGDASLVESIRADRRPNVYDLPLPRGAPHRTPLDGHGVHHSVERGAPQRRHGVRHSAPEETPKRPGTSPPPRPPADLRAELAALGADERETDWIIDWAKANARHDPGAYLAKIIGNGGGPGLLDRARAELDGQAAPRPPKPPWCRQCDERTRLIELPDGRMAHCPRCHPLAARGEP